MRNLENELKNRVINNQALLKYGFSKNGKTYQYTAKICNEQFEIRVEAQENQITSRLIDLFDEEEYILVDIPDSTGEFVGRLRKEYEDKLQEIINQCTTLNVFKSNQAKEIIKYVKEKYNDDLEFLWKKFDNNAIIRNKKNNKWYLLFCTISKRKLRIDSDEIIEMIDIRYQKGETEKIVDNHKIFPGYHMNKKSWITIKLDNSVDIKTIYQYIDNSYQLSIGNK